ncbi:MAG: FAD-binding oxidoreductase, partial [Desulfobacterales bacterium]|nr:FAD-binding oxidoreductase [Desulfobacterales bacterium]
MKNTDKITPRWIESPPKSDSFRSIFKWGDPGGFKNPSNGFLNVISSELGLTARDFAATRGVGDEPVSPDMPVALDTGDVDMIRDVVGEENLSVAVYDRLKYTSGKAMEDLMKLRECRVADICDLVVHPRDKSDVEKVVGICNDRGIPVHVYGGGSSVTFGLDCPKGGVTLVMSTHMNRMLSFSEADQTITVEPGMMGPVYEDLLNRAPETLGAKKAYTGGHFPQSFEFSSVGGWITALGSGQASSLYGDAADLVIAQEYVTPSGSFKTLAYPATATGPKVNEIMKGSEGCFGILVAVTFKVFEYLPENTRQFSFMFPDFESAVSAGREISQGRFGMPAIFRISDPEETDVAMQMYGLEGGIGDKLLRVKGMKPGSRCLVMGQAEGEKGFAANVAKQVRRIARQHRGMYLTGYPMRKWYHGRFSDPYMRDALNDYGVLIDTLECSTTWENLHHLHKEARAVVKSNPDTICMTHASHFYAQGTNLYFIFITRMKDIEGFRRYQQSIIDAIEKAGG